MSLSTLPLSYCTNVHPGTSVAEVTAGLRNVTAHVGRQFGHPLAAGLWLAQPAINELASQPTIDQLQQSLEEAGVVCYTLNAFPYGNFHGDRVKEQVYLPDWTSADRLDYTWGCAQVLAAIMPEGTEGSLSTVPLGFKGLPHDSNFMPRCAEQLVQLAGQLDALHDETGRVVRLAIEPEPLCVLETTAETLTFFESVWRAAQRAGLTEAARRHLGICYDVCHQSVEFEDVAESIKSIRSAGVRLNKIHLTCAIRLEWPADNVEGRKALAHFAEPRYLHQTFARSADGTILSLSDLEQSFCESPPASFAAADEWRVHFHVPVNAESIGPLKTTRDDLKLALQTVAGLEYAPHLEVETYTWGVLPDSEKPSLIDGLTAELSATRKLLDDLRDGTSSTGQRSS
ncbi:MAG: metabolite traffic protein EboE [Planctomycetaceae bacterium]